MEKPSVRQPLLILSTLAALCVAGLAASPGAIAQEGVRLPDMGSSAGTLITPIQEAQYGAMYLRELRRYGLVLDDPLIDSWLDSLGFDLAAATEHSRGSYTFFTMRSRQVNAFATLGGYIGMNAGLVLTAQSEDEVAAVMAHEIAHVTQRHIVRSVEAAQKDAPLILLGMLAGLVAASQTSGDGAQAVIAGGMGLMAQRQINHTRSAEHEADRLGIQTLARAGYDPNAMASFFGRMARVTRAGGGDGNVPEFLRTHPVTTTRISEARDRANRIETETRSSGPEPVRVSHPMLPAGLATSGTNVDGRRGSSHFDLARERLRVLSATSPRIAATEYRNLKAGRPGGLDRSERYGYALARTASGQAPAAVEELEQLLESEPGNFWLRLAHAEALHQAGRWEAATLAYEALHGDLPDNRAVALSYARALNDRGSQESGARAQVVLRPLVRRAGNDFSFHRIHARASELAGDRVRAAESHAEAAFLSGRAEDALNQLRRLQSGDELDYIQRARVSARIDQLLPVVLEMQRQGIGPDGQPRNS